MTPDFASALTVGVRISSLLPLNPMPFQPRSSTMTAQM